MSAHHSPFLRVTSGSWQGMQTSYHCKVEFDQMSKYNLDDITAAIKKDVNARLGSDLIQDVLIDELNYVDKDSLKQADTKQPDAAQPPK